ncbi:hypothetical protein [Nocardioides marmotae]|uniref:hypothetical protein n=1 Tax=Nocardioides marmotae TaxID=2663857 RepID=UPI0012B67548|nr:hypothetical protein [Nocardioides marmotae]MBC9733375.1 hypothetical protein [Nocardioides marmotae]MTB84482.1 hypothetical protein [Nocardioides marmotae]
MIRLRTALLAPMVLTGALLAGCGEDEGTTVSDPAASASPSASGSESPTPSGDVATGSASGGPVEGPDCAEVWVAGETLPNGYQGCVAEGRLVKADGRYCEFGKPLITYDDRWWAVPGGRIGEAEGPLVRDRDYRAVLRKCGG